MMNRGKIGDIAEKFFDGIGVDAVNNSLRNRLLRLF
jgi:hypothetical protein